jgi:putative ABC transport system permease protein
MLFKNYLKIAFRNIARSKTFSIINILGLSVGLATCIIITLHVLNELKYDVHHANGDRVYRIATQGSEAGGQWAACPGPVAWALKSDLPEVEQVARLMTFPDIEKMLLRYENGNGSRQFFEHNGYYVDSTFFELFTYDFKYGGGRSVLDLSNSIVISEPMSVRFFGNTDPVGKPLNIQTPFGQFNYTVTGVFNTEGTRTHIPANFFLSMHNNDMWNWVRNQTNWATNNVFFTYVKLNRNAGEKTFENKLNTFFKKRAGSDLKMSGISKTLFIQPLKDIHLHSSIGNELEANGNILYLYILGSVAIFILMIACINFMNLSTARSERRAKEVGVRKVMGARKTSLIVQFLGESFMVCLLALIAALLLTQITLPFFKNLTGKDLQLSDSPALLIAITILTIVTGIIAGLYPAFYLSSFRPASVLKGKLLNNLSATTIRKGLVVFQFTISIFLVIGAIVIWQQLNYMSNQHLGFDKSRKIVLPLNYNNTDPYFTRLSNELLKNPGIRQVTSGSTYPGIPNINSMLFYRGDKTKAEVTDLELSAIDDNYISTLGFKILAGRSFSRDFKADSASLILNETAVRKFGLQPGEAIGKQISYDFQGMSGTMNIVGVVADFHFEGLQEKVKPFAFTTGVFANKYTYMIADLAAGDYQQLIKDIESTWKKLDPATPFEFSFLDQDFQRNYEAEKRTSGIVAGFTIIAMVIACLGLFGLAAFSAEQKTKEIGIRKVLGASLGDISTLLSRDFLVLVIVGILIASPIAWYVMNRWLNTFAYKISLSWQVIAIAGLVAIVIALLTVSSQAIKAGLANPVKSLRNE